MPPSKLAGLPPLPAQASLLQGGTANSVHPPHLQAVAVEVIHNLRHQHYWTALRLHHLSPVTAKPLPRPIVSGLPPRRIYVHPDDQIEELKQELKEKDAEVEREWVLPTRLREKWSLRKFGEVFDAIGEVPDVHGDGVEAIAEPGRRKTEEVFEDHNATEGEVDRTPLSIRKRRATKRLLLATVGDDSTIVYYIVHDGVVKPRQN